MAIIVKFDVTGLDASNYDAIIQQLEAIGQGTPDGRMYHVCYGDKRNLQVIDVFESPAKLEAFAEKMMPIAQKYGVVSKPEVTETYNVIDGHSAAK